MPTIEYRIGREPAGDRYRSLIDAGLQHGDILLLIVRPRTELTQAGRELLAKLEPYLIDASEKSEWPGTQLFGSAVTVYKFRFNFESAERIKDAATRLYDWVHPELPEDPCILRSDGTPWLVTISHERFACLELTESELEELKRTAPSLIKSLRTE